MTQTITRQNITLEEVKAACRAAYNAHTLLAQYDGAERIDYGYRVFTNDGVERRCGIGVALSKDTLDEIDASKLSSQTIISPFNLKYENDLGDVIGWTADDQGELGRIQVAHDNWLGAVMEGNSGEPYKDSFERRIDLCPSQAT